MSEYLTSIIRETDWKHPTPHSQSRDVNGAVKLDRSKTIYKTRVTLRERFKCEGDWDLLSLDSGLIMESTNMGEILKTLIRTIEQFNAINVSFGGPHPRRTLTGDFSIPRVNL